MSMMPTRDTLPEFAKHAVASPIVILALLLASLLGISAAHAETVQVPGTTVSMDPPEGFEISDTFAGFQQLKTSNSILVVEMPKEAYSEISTIFESQDSAASALASQGITVTGVSSIDINGEAVNLVQGVQSAQGLEVGKYLMVLDGNMTAMITINVIDDSLSESEAIDALQSVTLGTPASLEEQLGQLIFKYQDAAPFVHNQVMAGSAASISTFEGTDPSGKKPFIIITNSLSSFELGDLQAASEMMLAQTADLQDAEVSTGEIVESAGGDAFRVEARAPDMLAIHYLWARPDNNYLRLAAMGAPDLLEPLIAQVDTVAKSVSFR
ncbi:hypothetical protein [Granulosicoccus antarcticus]|uniref:DUF1795 domain-containing protein n=1 Tax=Granulosicoccus antarcticus IMCC3135 TaxID=1192854 RepID=A0A2Z2NP28_9GAMM|nr:hypothetical protein [Granulosicoccus antarcticus]ASJ73232.1 hypothetical protein IMCC3135_15750 [Granulosicoccus antarcticus IMCC3135]